MITDEQVKIALSSWFNEPVDDAYQEHIDNMRNALEAYEQSKWIDIRTQQPKHNEEVLNSNGVADVYWDEEEGTWKQGGFKIRYATHWQHLPEFKE